jgi:hypothetical protein
MRTGRCTCRSAGVTVGPVIGCGRGGETLSDEFGVPADELFDALRVHTDTAA